MNRAFEWDQGKNRKLIQERGVSFEAVVALIEEDRILGVIPGAGKYAHQKQFVILIGEYVYFVPFIENENSIFLKTIVPSRKLTKRYLSGEI